MARSAQRRRSVDDEMHVEDVCDGDAKPLLPNNALTVPKGSRHLPRLSLTPVLSYSSGLAAKHAGAQAEVEPVSFDRDVRENDSFVSISTESMNQIPTNHRTVTLAKEQTEMVLKEQLQRLQEELKLKDDECSKMHEYRDRVSAELEDLTATLFEEANKMVREEKIRRHRAEKLYTETNMKLEALQTEAVWRREQMSASIKSAKPQRSASLHVLNTPFHSREKAESFDSLSFSNIIQWFRGTKPPDDEPLTNGLHLDLSLEEGATVRKEADPIAHAEFVSWRQKPSLSRGHPLIDRIYKQDIEPNFEFSNKELAEKVLQAVEGNTVFIEEGSKYKPFAKVCTLSNAPRACIYRMKFTDDSVWYPISAFARNRITSVCDFFTYVRYIQLGLVRRGVHDTWWEVVRHRERMSQARLGVL